MEELLGTNAQWLWYNTLAHVIQLEQVHQLLLVNQTSTTSYFVRAEGDCNTTLCKNITVDNHPYFIELGFYIY